MHENTVKQLENEISSYKSEANKQRKLIFELEKERDRHINETAIMTQRSLEVRPCDAQSCHVLTMQQALEEVKAAENQIFEFKKKISEAESKLKQQQRCGYWSIRKVLIHDQLIRERALGPQSVQQEPD